MTEGMQQEAPATIGDPVAAFLAEAIEKLDALLDGPRVEPASPPDAEKKPRKKKAVIGEVSPVDAAFKPRAAA
jgi:hypothetical protein